MFLIIAVCAFQGSAQDNHLASLLSHVYVQKTMLSIHQPFDKPLKMMLVMASMGSPSPCGAKMIVTSLLSIVMLRREGLFCTTVWLGCNVCIMLNPPIVCQRNIRAKERGNADAPPAILIRLSRGFRLQCRRHCMGGRKPKEWR